MIPVRKTVAIDLEICESFDFPKRWLKNKSEEEIVASKSYISMTMETRQLIIAFIKQREGIDYEIVTSSRKLTDGSDASDDSDSDKSCTWEWEDDPNEVDSD